MASLCTRPLMPSLTLVLIREDRALPEAALGVYVELPNPPAHLAEMPLF